MSLVPVDEALAEQQDQQRVGQQQHEQHQRDRRGIAEVEPLEGLGEDVARHVWVRSAGPPPVMTMMRSAKFAIQTVRSSTVMAMVGARKGRVIDQKRCKRVGAVDGRGLVEVGGDRLQGGEQRDGEERDAPPDLRR